MQGVEEFDTRRRKEMDLHLYMEVDRVYMDKGKTRRKESTKEKERRRMDFSLGLSTWQRSWTWLERQKEKTEENRKERGVNQKERTKVKESLDRISAVTICNLVMGQEIVLTRCVSSRVIKANSSNNLAKRRCSITVSWRTRQTMQFYSSKFKQLKTEESVQHWYAELVIRVYGIRFRCVTTTQEAPEELG